MTDAPEREPKKLSKPVKDQKGSSLVGTIAANVDQVIGALIVATMETVGKDGVVTVEEAKAIETSRTTHPFYVAIVLFHLIGARVSRCLDAGLR